MDWTKIEKLFNEVVKEYEKSEMFSIMAYSSNMQRDIRLLNDKVTDFKIELAKLRDGDTSKTGNSIRKEDLQKEPV